MERHWGFFPYSSPWNGPHDFLLGTIRVADGRDVACDALASIAYADEDPANEAARIKVAILNRWVSEHGLVARPENP